MTLINTLFLVAGALFFVVFPWLKISTETEFASSGKSRQQENVFLYEQRCDGYKKQRDQGEISAEQCDQLIMESQRILLEENALEAQPQRQIDGFWLVPVLGLFLLMTTVPLYDVLGGAEDEEIKTLLMKYPPDTALEAADLLRMERIGELIDQRVQTRPDNLYYWIFLAQLAQSRSDRSAAAEYFDNALGLDPKNTYLLASYAEALFLLDGKITTDRVREAVDRAFLADANNTATLSLKGISEFSESRFEEAIEFWGRAQQTWPIDSDQWRSLQVGIDRAENALRPAEMEQVSTDKSPILQIHLSFGAEVPHSREQRVFVAVLGRDAVEGDRMPIAARKLVAGDLPLTLTLSDSDSLVRSRRLSDQRFVQVTARLSGGGTATPQSGDWEGLSAIVDLHSEPGELRLEISGRRP